MEITTLFVIAVTFLLAGAVKGVIGLGLPTVALALLTATLGLEPAMALMLAPSFVTNVWQGMVGGHGRAIAARLWPFMAAAVLTVWVGAAMAEHVAVALLSALLGFLTLLYGTIGLARASLTLPHGTERWASPVTGAVNGVLTGMTGTFVVPSVLYMQALGLPRDMLIQAMGVLFTLSTMALAVALSGRGLLDADLGLQSALAVVPALIGMGVGQCIRQRISEATFRRVLFVSLVVLGLFIIARSLG